jgi:hypothetical protein
MKPFLPILIIALFMSSCKSRVNLEAGTFSGKHIKVGTQLPFVNETIEVVLVKDGRVFMKKPSKAYEEVHKMKRLHAWALMKGVKKSGITKKEVNDPGMISYYLQYNTKANSYKWVWGKKGVGPPDELEETLNELMGYMK